ncbi:hypothetical protein [Sphingobium indicum]|uniref:hypothetical protein n=1 Tax=Sphingobium indicum TaxID=332055 RepID=UPI0012DC9C8C|nr:hypothetical protein [Sphingobium indicum]
MTLGAGIESTITAPHATIAIDTARARQPRALDLNGGFSLNLSLAIGLLYDRKWVGSCLFGHNSWLSYNFSNLGASNILQD